MIIYCNPRIYTAHAKVWKGKMDFKFNRYLNFIPLQFSNVMGCSAEIFVIGFRIVNVNYGVFDTFYGNWDLPSENRKSI